MKANYKPLPLSEFKKEIEKGAILLDTRKADDFEKGFISGSINIGLNGQFAVWVGTLINIKKPIVLVSDEGTERETILRLARVGYENVVGYLQGGVGAWTGTLETIHSISAEQMKKEITPDTKVLDVRKPGEWSVSHLKNASFVPLSDFPKNLSSFNHSKPYIVHCGGGYRSMTAISIMRKEGFTNLTNVYGGFSAMIEAGLEVVTEEAFV